MSNQLVPPAPYATPMTDSNGRITQAWSNWFRQIFLRVGGADAPSNSTISENSSTVSSLQAQVTTIQANVTSLQGLVHGLDVGRQL